MNFIRLFLALLVVFSHSFDLGRYTEPLNTFSKGQIGFGGLAVNYFFIISGILITHSFMRSKSKLLYLYKRFIRLFPALLVCTIMTICIVGPTNTDLLVTDYFSNKETYNYFWNNIFQLESSYLPGVFI